MEEKKKSIKYLMAACILVIVTLLIASGIYCMNMPKNEKTKSTSKYDKSIYGEYIMDQEKMPVTDEQELTCPFDKLYLKEDGTAYYFSSNCMMAEIINGPFKYKDGIVEFRAKYICSDLKSGKYYEPDDCDGTIEEPDGTVTGFSISFKIDVANKKIIYISNYNLKISASSVKATYKWKKLPDVMPVCGEFKNDADYQVETSELILFKDGTYMFLYKSPCDAGRQDGTYEEKDGKLILTCKNGQCDKGDQTKYSISTTGLVEVSDDKTTTTYTKVSNDDMQLVIIR